MEEALLPEEILVLILTFLPVKSLIRFTCVSKRLRFVILSDPKFARSQWKAASELKTLTHRLLLCTIQKKGNQLFHLDSLDLDRPSVRKLAFPFEQPELKETLICGNLLGSSNGIVFLAFHHKIIYMWNPSIGFFKRLPDLVLPPHYYVLNYYGVGYFPATDDYRVFMYYDNIERRGNMGDTAFVFSTRAKAWKNHQVKTTSLVESVRGTTLNEALHWVDQHGRIVAFDLGDEEGKFREMSPPNFENEDGDVRYAINLGVSSQGCLTLARYPPYFNHGCCCIDVWVMNEYNVCGSWTKFFNLKLSDDPPGYVRPSSLLLMGTCMVAEVDTKRGKACLIRTDHKDEGKHDKYEFEGIFLNMIQVQETLLWIYD